MIDDLSYWAEFGFSSLMVGALLAVLIWLFREHRAERREWSAAQDRRDDKLTQAMRSLEAVIRDARR